VLDQHLPLRGLVGVLERVGVVEDHGIGELGHDAVDGGVEGDCAGFDELDDRDLEKEEDGLIEGPEIRGRVDYLRSLLVLSCCRSRTYCSRRPSRKRGSGRI
jgi:hypothetical protein